MIKIKNIVIKNKFLSIMTLTYLVLFIIKTDLGLRALKNSGYYFKEMLIIMPVIMILTALLEAWVPKETIEKNMGENSGFKGKLFSFILGSISAGPIYAAFPVCIALLRKGASVANIVILLGTWAVIKVPMLANEVKFLGFEFMIIRWILTSISLFIMGYGISKFVTREEILKLQDENKKDTEDIYIDRNFCIGCGICVNTAPDYFEIRDKKAYVIKKDNLTDTKLRESAKKCPVKIIKIKDN